MMDIMSFWLDQGLDGFRCDAVPYLFEREGTICENLPETHAYLKKIRKRIDEAYQGRILLAEANQWPADVRPYFGDGDEFHGVSFSAHAKTLLGVRVRIGTPLSICSRTRPRSLTIANGACFCGTMTNVDIGNVRR